MSNQQSTDTAFTLVEVMITIVIIAVVFLSVAGAMIYNNRTQKLARERSQAQREAGMLLEEARRFPFNQLNDVAQPNLFLRTVRVDDNRTADQADDVMGTARLRLFRRSDDVELPSSTGALGEEFVRAQAEVEWTSGRRTQRVILVTDFAPPSL
jgi:prepilin-type N-terminal cleavage/methylation domain-containing protein